MKRSIVTVILVFGLSLFVGAEEGMWLLDQIKNLGLKDKGMEIDAAQIYSPDQPCIVNGVIRLGATAEIVSPQGLVLTNHHVAFRAVQRASTKGIDLISRGFLAKTRDEEIEAPGYSAYILEYMKDVTADFRRFDRIRDPLKREKAIEHKIKKITDKIEKGKPDISAEVEAMFEGKRYILFVHKRFDDVRVVYVPPSAIGNYGGEIDNWMWPRHTGDFSFMRIYMAPDGSGRKYHQDNIPYKPKYWLRVATEGLKEGDLTFILGYPGTTRRYLTSYAVDEYLNYLYPHRIKLFLEIIALMESFEKDSLIAKMKVAGLIKGLNNGLKNYQGNVEGMERTDFLGQKREFEKKFTAFLKKNKELYQQYGGVLAKIKGQYEARAKTRDHDSVLGLLNRLSGTIAGTAADIYRTAREREKPRSERDPSFSERDVERRVSRLKFGYMSFYEPADRALLKRTLERAADLPTESRIKGLEDLLKGGPGAIDSFLDQAYQNSRLKDVEFAQSLFKKSVRELEALNDPFIQLAQKLYPESEARRKRNDKIDAAISQLRRQHIEALAAWKGSELYPDANGTIRFSYGVVAGYKPRDAVTYAPFTTLTGVVEKNTGKSPFDMPPLLAELYNKKDFGRWLHPDLNDIPVCFTHKVDSTGGSSGSPVLNARGELVGILFDGNYEALTSDWQYDNDLQRSISVDMRYVMFITEKLAKAYHLLEEMGIPLEK
jgi:hypothetical protein